MLNAASDLPEDAALLKALIAQLQAQNKKLTTTLRAHDLVVQALRLQIARLRKQAFGKSSEKIEREIEQLEFALEDVLVSVAQQGLVTSDLDDSEAQAAAASAETTPEPRPSRRPRVSADTPRQRHELDPGSTCPECGGELRLVGEDVSEILEMITAKLQVIEVARPKKSCRCCEKMVQVPAPSRPIPGSMAGGSLLAYVLISKFDDHLPLYRQNEIIARMGADIPRSTLADWCGRSMRILQPVIDRIEASVLGSDILHADDTPIRVLAPERRAKGIGKGVMQGRIWGDVCDQRPWAGTAPPGVLYRYAPNWKAEHVLAHLGSASGILQADAYKGYAKLYEPVADGEPRFREAACFAHWRRDFHDIWTSQKSEIAHEALERIGQLYDIEREIAGKPADIRQAVRQELSRPKLEALHSWAEQQLIRISTKGDLAKAFRYALGRWHAFSLFIDDGRVAIDNNAAERAVRPICLGKKNWLFAGSETGAETLARAMTLIESAKMNGLDPQTYITDLLNRIHDHKINRIDELLP
ncbi:IS66 family transposase (plasmid) [Sphingobium limneticum]